MKKENQVLSYDAHNFSYFQILTLMFYFYHIHVKLTSRQVCYLIFRTRTFSANIAVPCKVYQSLKSANVIYRIPLNGHIANLSFPYINGCNFKNKLSSIGFFSWLDRSSLLIFAHNAQLISTAPHLVIYRWEKVDWYIVKICYLDLFLE